MPTSLLAREPSAIPTPVTTVYPLPNLNISQSCCCERLRGACFFSCFFVSPRRAERPDIFFQKTPRPHSKRPGAFFYVCKTIAPQGAFTCTITVLAGGLHIIAVVHSGTDFPRLLYVSYRHERVRTRALLSSYYARLARTYRCHILLNSTAVIILMVRTYRV